MPLYKIWLRDKRETKVEGDNLVLGGVSYGSLPAELALNDVGVIKGDKLVAHFRAQDVAGYQEIDSDSEMPYIA